MLKDYRKWYNKSKNILEVYDHSSERYFYRPLTEKEQSAINTKHALEELAELDGELVTES